MNALITLRLLLKDSKLLVILVFFSYMNQRLLGSLCYPYGKFAAQQWEACPLLTQPKPGQHLSSLPWVSSFGHEATEWRLW